MKFISIAQYFNKLQIALFMLLMAPLLAFIALYFITHNPSAEPKVDYQVGLLAIVLVNWLFSVAIFNKKIKTARNQQGLGAKLDKYFKITIDRFTLLSISGLLLAGGLYITGGDVFIGVFLAGLIYSGILWPTGRKVCRDLRLRGDEREMVYYRKDDFN